MQMTSTVKQTKNMIMVTCMALNTQQESIAKQFKAVVLNL